MYPSRFESPHYDHWDDEEDEMWQPEPYRQPEEEEDDGWYAPPTEPVVGDPVYPPAGERRSPRRASQTGGSIADTVATAVIVGGVVWFGWYTFRSIQSGGEPIYGGGGDGGDGGGAVSANGGGRVLPVGGGAFGGVEWEHPPPEEFVANVRKFIDDDPEMGAFLTVHSPSELEGYTLIGTENGAVGVAVSPEGDLQNLYNHSGPSGAGEEAIERAIEAGGRTLDCYDGFLRDLYVDHGFRETGRMEFDPAYAPPGWDEDRFGHPDVVFMAYQPEKLSAPESDNYYEPSEWEQAKADSRRAADFG